MWKDDSGVAGFFEDLPVLMLVLGGTMLLVSSGVWTSTRLGEHHLTDELHETARRAMEGIVDRIESLSSDRGTATLKSIEQANLSQSLAELLGTYHFVFNVSDLCHPERWSMRLNDDSSGEISCTGYARRLMNGLDSSGLLVILEVRLVVWKE